VVLQHLAGGEARCACGGGLLGSREGPPWLRGRPAAGGPSSARGAAAAPAADGASSCKAAWQRAGRERRAPARSAASLCPTRGWSCPPRRRTACGRAPPLPTRSPRGPAAAAAQRVAAGPGARPAAPSRGARAPGALGGEVCSCSTPGPPPERWAAAGRAAMQPRREAVPAGAGAAGAPAGRRAACATAQAHLQDVPRLGVRPQREACRGLEHVARELDGVCSGPLLRAAPGRVGARASELWQRAPARKVWQRPVMLRSPRWMRWDHRAPAPPWGRREGSRGSDKSAHLDRVAQRVVGGKF
jgi:hypothetical protein